MRCSTSAALLIGYYTFISTTLSFWFVSLPITVFAANEKVVSITDDNVDEEESSSSDDYDDIDEEYISILEQVQKLVDNDNDDVDRTPEEEKIRLKELIQSVDDNNIVSPELLKLLVDSIIDEEDDIVIKEEDDDEEKEYNPMGIQTWDEDSILQATKGGRLLLVILTSLSCDKSTDFIHNEATLAADMLDESLFKLSSSTLDFNLPTSVTKPLIGMIDNTSTDFSHIFGTITHYPTLKFIRLVSDATEVVQNEDCDTKDETCQEEKKTSVESESEVLQTWEYISSIETAKDIHDTVLLYWYRHVVSNAMSNQTNESTIDSSGAAPIFTFSSQTDLSTFLQTHGSHALKPAQPRRQHHSKLEEEVFNFYMGINEDLSGVFHNYEYINDDSNDSVSKDEQFTQEIDPYLLLVQCRSQFDYGEVDLMEDKTDERISTDEMILLQNQQQAVQNFDQLAEQMATRSDVAFVALNASVHDADMISDPIEHVCDELFDDIGGPSNGDVAFMRARRYVTYSVEDNNDAVKNNDHQDKKQQNHNVRNNQRKRVIHNIETDWGDGVKLLSPHAIVVPSSSSDETISKHQKEIHGKLANKDPTTPIEYIQSNLVASTIVHSTPTVMWYDKERIAQLAFPWYRKVHAVLFVDMALSYKEWRSTSRKQHPSWPSSLHHSSETVTLLLSQQKAIQMFYNAALRHRVKRPADDLVFLIVPSSEIRIMTSFGVDIWTPLDEALFSITDDTDDEEDQEYQEGQRDNGYCNSPSDRESRNILPVMMITDSSGRSGLQSSRYYLCSKDILNNDGAIDDFIDKFFKGTIEPFTRSESTPPSSEATDTTRHHSQSTNKPNVTILTGNTFESLVMNRRDEHQIIFISSYSCGHCKRFSIFCNELSLLIQAMNWDSVITVMKIDVSKNDVPHEKINAWDLPAVYYFPAYDKQNPIEMTPVEGKTNPQHDYDEGLTWITSGYDIAKWMISQNKLDLNLLSRLEKGIQHNLDSEIRI